MGLKPSAAVTGTGFGQGLTVARNRRLRGAHPWGPHACVRSAHARRSRAAPFNPGFFFLLIELQKQCGAGAACSHPLLKEQAAPGPHKHTGEAAPCSLSPQRRGRRDAQKAPCHLSCHLLLGASG